MRTTLAALWFTLAVAHLPAAPLPTPAVPTARPEREPDSREFAARLRMVVDRVAEQYVEDVPREALVESALTDLYRAARVRVPSGLRDRVAAAQREDDITRVALERQLAAQPGGPNAPWSGPMPVRTSAVERLLAATHLRLCESPHLASADALVIALRGVAKLLDPHSGPADAISHRRTAGVEGGERTGVGLEFADDSPKGSLVVATVHAGGPAQRAGLRDGDRVVKMGDTPVSEVDPTFLAAYVADAAGGATGPPEPIGPPEGGGRGTLVWLPASMAVTYRRDGKDHVATLERKTYHPESVFGVRRDGTDWDFVADAEHGVAYLRVSHLTRGTSEEVRRAVSTAVAKKARAVILDLRWCPGGYLNEAVAVAELFLGPCVVAKTVSRNREDTVFRSDGAAAFRDIPMVVLVNGDTSGGGELVAAALQDHKRAVVMGSRTKGKTSVQVPLSTGVPGLGFKLTTGTFLRPSEIDAPPKAEKGATAKRAWAVEPDEDFRVSPEMGRRLLGLHRLHAMRPPGSRQRLPLDDEEGDVQRRAAVIHLREALSRGGAKKSAAGD